MKPVNAFAKHRRQTKPQRYTRRRAKDRKKPVLFRLLLMPFVFLILSSVWHVSALAADYELSVLAANLTVGTVTAVISETVPTGKVMSQNPSAGVQVALGSSVNLVVSSGSAFRFVPDLIDLPQAVAEADITEANLVVGSVTSTSSRTVPAGIVLSQDPAPGTQVSVGSAVNLVVSSGLPKVIVGNYFGWWWGYSLVQEIIGDGLVVGDVTSITDCDWRNYSIVLGQEPVYGTEVLEGSPVNITVCVAPGMRAVPNVVNMEQSLAEETIGEANLVVGPVTRTNSATVALGNVLNQAPGVGAIVAEGTPVSLVISTGPGPTLVEKQIFAMDPGENDAFGNSVSIDGDTAGIGAWVDDDNGKDSGSVYIFYRNQGGLNNWGQVKKLTAYDGISNEYFGTSVAIRGDTLVVGARASGGWYNWVGAVYVYYRNEGGTDNWGLVKKITASDPVWGAQLGAFVSLEGDTIVAGASGNGGWDCPALGAAYVFYRNRGGADNWES